MQNKYHHYLFARLDPRVDPDTTLAVQAESVIDYLKSIEDHQCQLITLGYCPICDHYLSKIGKTVYLNDLSTPRPIAADALIQRSIIVARKYFLKPTPRSERHIESQANARASSAIETMDFITKFFHQAPTDQHHACPPTECHEQHLSDHTCPAPTPCPRQHLDNHICPVPTLPSVTVPPKEYDYDKECSREHIEDHECLPAQCFRRHYPSKGKSKKCTKQHLVQPTPKVDINLVKLIDQLFSDAQSEIVTCVIKYDDDEGYRCANPQCKTCIIAQVFTTVRSLLDRKLSEIQSIESTRMPYLKFISLSEPEVAILNEPDSESEDDQSHLSFKDTDYYLRYPQQEPISMRPDPVYTTSEVQTSPLSPTINDPRSPFVRPSDASDIASTLSVSSKSSKSTLDSFDYPFVDDRTGLIIHDYEEAEAAGFPGPRRIGKAAIVPLTPRLAPLSVIASFSNSRPPSVALSSPLPTASRPTLSTSIGLTSPRRALAPFHPTPVPSSSNMGIQHAYRLARQNPTPLTPTTFKCATLGCTSTDHHPDCPNS